MFRTTNRNAAAPVSTFIFSNLSPGSETSTVLEEFRANDVNTKSSLGAIIKRLAITATTAKVEASVAGFENTNDLISNCSAMFRKGAAEEYLIMLNAKPSDTPTESDDINTAIELNVNNATLWIINFVNAAKKKTLEQDNVEGWFAELGHTGSKGAPIASLINRVSPFFPDMIDDENFRDSLAPGIWSSYRQTRVSAGKIMYPMFEDFRALGITEEDDDVEEAIKECNDNPWNTNLSLSIQSKYKAYAALFLQCCGKSLDEWHQGNKAVDELPAAKVRKVKEIFKKYLEVKNESTGIDTITDVAGFRTTAVTDTW